MPETAWSKMRRKLRNAKVRSEASIQDSVTGHAKRDKGAHWRVTKRSHAGSHGSNGEPDYEFVHRTCSRPGRPLHFFLIEFKKPGEGPTEYQQEKINDWRSLGVRVYVCDDAGAGRAIVTKEEGLCCKNTRKS
jgi:hypothetical protein